MSKTLNNIVRVCSKRNIIIFECLSEERLIRERYAVVVVAVVDLVIAVVVVVVVVLVIVVVVVVVVVLGAVFVENDGSDGDFRSNFILSFRTSLLFSFLVRFPV